MSSRPAFCGSRRKLVLAFDVGTTYSGISYIILDPGQVPEIKSVTRFPAHVHIYGASKIPTTIYYDQAGEVRAVGAETTKEGIYEIAEDENWVKAEWFKLQLRSKLDTETNVALDKLPPLPLGKTVVDVFADFLKYLFQCASIYIRDTHANGLDLWNSVKDGIVFVLSHPNGWDGTQQGEMRKAAVLADLIPDDVAGRARLSFVTEGEASLHFSVQNGLPTGAMENGEGVIIVDAGGGTIDVSSYTISRDNSEKQVFEEIAAPQCHFHGSVFVSVNAQLYLSNLLVNSTFVDDVKQIVNCFDKTTKLRFRNAEEPQYIKFGSTRDNELKYNIRFGQIKLSGSDVAMFFEPSVDCIIQAVKEQKTMACKKISHVVIVGGFAANDWLFNKVMERCSEEDLKIFRPESQANYNKAVADGAISFYLDHIVRTRISKFTYGIFGSLPFDPKVEDHVQRRSRVFISISGYKRISDVFAAILPKNTQVSETKEFRHSCQFCLSHKGMHELRSIVFPVYCYHGAIADPKWADVDTENYSELCTIEVELSRLPSTRKIKSSWCGTYFLFDFEVILLFGTTELQAQVAWRDGFVERRSPVTILYDREYDSKSNKSI